MGDRETSDDDGQRVFWLTQAVLFVIVLVAVSMVFSTLRDTPPPGESVTGLVAVRMVLLVGIAGLLQAVYRLPWIERLRGLPLLATILAVCLAASLLDLVAFRFGVWWLMPASLGFVERYPLLAIVGRTFFCLGWTAVYFLFRQQAAARKQTRLAAAAELRAARAEIALRESELERLGQHVEPHFLFNALSAVLACRHDPDAVEAVTTALSEYLRFCLSRGGDPEPLAHELDAIEQLLAVHEARFGDDLRCSVASSPAARTTAVPPLVLAPLVDNALKYATRTAPPPWRVAVTARVDSGRLVIEVANSGRWVEPDPERPRSGLANLERRLELGGFSHRIDFTARDGIVTARLSLPVETTAEASSAALNRTSGTAPGAAVATRR